jgi:hypothetical protein
MQGAIWELDSETELWAERWRTGRLQDIGFPPLDEALPIYAHLSSERLAELPEDARALDVDAWRLPVFAPQPPLAPDARQLVFRPPRSWRPTSAPRSCTRCSASPTRWRSRAACPLRRRVHAGRDRARGRALQRRPRAPGRAAFARAVELLRRCGWSTCSASAPICVENAPRGRLDRLRDTSLECSHDDSHRVGGAGGASAACASPSSVWATVRARSCRASTTTGACRPRRTRPGA